MRYGACLFACGLTEVVTDIQGPIEGKREDVGSADGPLAGAGLNERNRNNSAGILPALYIFKLIYNFPLPSPLLVSFLFPYLFFPGLKK